MNRHIDVKPLTKGKLYPISETVEFRWLPAGRQMVIRNEVIFRGSRARLETELGCRFVILQAAASTKADGICYVFFREPGTSNGDPYYRVIIVAASTK